MRLDEVAVLGAEHAPISVVLCGHNAHAHVVTFETTIVTCSVVLIPIGKKSVYPTVSYCCYLRFLSSDIL